MSLKRLKIPYGNGSIEFSLPSDRLLGILGEEPPAHKDIRELLSEAFEDASAELKRLTHGADKILVVVPDCTRAAHLKELLPHLFKEDPFIAARIEIIVATGLHEKHTAPQLKNLLGDGIFRRYRVTSHSQDKRSLVNFGFTKSGIPIVLNKILKRYNTVITIGVIEPHLYAGYSGGAKTVAIGLAGEKTINITHNVKFLDNPLTRIGSVKDNPFQNALWEIADKVPVRFSLNIVNDSDGKPLKIFAGTPKSVFKEGLEYAKKVFEVRARTRSDMVICGVGYPKDINLYQASRAVNYVINDRPILRKNGVLIIVAQMRDGVGGGLSEKRFHNELKRILSPEDFVAKIKRRGCRAGEHRAYMVAKPMMDYNVIFVSKNCKGFMRGLPLNYFEKIDDALDYAEIKIGRGSKIYVVPHSLSTIARLEV